MNPMRLGIIGFSQGFYATTYARHAAKLKDVDIVACCDLGKSAEYVKECAGTTADQFAAEIGCRRVSDLDAFFSLRLDAVMVTSEVWEHAKHAEMALAHGCHVFVGKPLSFLPQDVRSVMAKAEAAGKIVLPGNPLRYESPLGQMAERIRAGEIGRPINIRIMVNHEAMVHQEWERDPGKSGGPLGTFGIYLIDTLRWLTGHELETVYATGGQFVFPEIGTWDTVQAMGATSQGALYQFNLVSTVTWDFPFVKAEIIGTKGAIRTGHYRYSYVLQNPGTTLGPIRYDPMGPKEIEHFLDCCRGKCAPAMTLKDMLAAAEGIQAIERSLKTGQIQRLPTQGDSGTSRRGG